MRFWSAVWAIFWKDVRAEFRTKDILTGMLVFAILAVLVFNFAFDLRVERPQTVIPGVMWVAIIFASMLGLNRSFILEQDRGSLAGILLAPVDRSAIYLGKVLGNLVFMFAVEVILLPIMVVLFNVNVLMPSVLLFVGLGTVGFAVVGTIFSAIAVNTRAREVMLPVLLLPVMVPVVIAAVKGTAGILDGNPLSEQMGALRLLIAFDVIFLGIAFLTFDYVLEE
ncbi:MAG: ABC transporter permease [Chloroflexi bacterium]|nr:ABC transporter permease [Chloroflexota bacterium]